MKVKQFGQIVLEGLEIAAGSVYLWPAPTTAYPIELETDTPFALRCEAPVPHPSDPRCPNAGTLQINGVWLCPHHVERVPTP